MLGACLTSVNLLQILGPQTLIDLTAKVDFLTNGMITLTLLLLPLRSYFVGSAWQSKFLRYSGSYPFRHL